jgi:hypothetical protein
VAPEEPEISVGAVSGEPGSDQADRAAIPAMSQPPGYTLKVTTRLVDVSLVADDKKGHPGKRTESGGCRGLTTTAASKRLNTSIRLRLFRRAQAGRPWMRANLCFQTALSDTAAGSSSTPQTDAGATILLIDESHIAWSDMSHARTQMLKFLATTHPDERIGLYTMTSLGFRVLAEVTTDHAAVSALLQKWMPTAQSASQAQDEETRTRQQFE